MVRVDRLKCILSTQVLFGVRVCWDEALWRTFVLVVTFPGLCQVEDEGTIASLLDALCLNTALLCLVAFLEIVTTSTFAAVCPVVATRFCAPATFCVSSEHVSEWIASHCNRDCKLIAILVEQG